MKSRIMVSMLLIALMAALIGGATMAWFWDQQSTGTNTFAAGTLELTVGSQDSVPINLTNMAPGQTSQYYRWVLKNNGTLPGKLSVIFGTVQNTGAAVLNRPKRQALEEYYNVTGDEVINRNIGHLGWFLKTGKHPDVALEGLVENVDYIMKERNDEEGWYIVELINQQDIPNSMGFSPVGWTVPSRIFSVWTTGPKHPWGTPGINGLSEITYGTFGFLPGDVLQAGQEVQFMFRVSLDGNLKIWTGTHWIEVNDNIIQGDSLSFNITFRLDQVQP